MNLAVFFNTVLADIQAIGYLKFGLLVVMAIVLWRIHPILGILSTAFIVAFIFGVL